MGTTDIISALQTINAAITGVTTAPTAMPGTLTNADLPCCLVYPGPGEHAPESMAHLATRRQWLMRLYIKNIRQGAGVDEGYQAALPFLERFRDEYADQIHTAQASDYWRCLEYIGDSGIIIMTLHGVPPADQTPMYWGIEFTVRLTEYTASTV